MSNVRRFDSFPPSAVISEIEGTIIVESAGPVRTRTVPVPVPTNIYIGTNSPLAWNSNDYYISGSYSVLYSLLPDFNVTTTFFSDDGVITPAILAGLVGTPAQATLYVYLCQLPDIYSGARVTLISDALWATVLAWLADAGLPNSILDYSEVAYELDPATEEYSNVMTVSVCAASGTTSWVDPAVIAMT